MSDNSQSSQSSQLERQDALKSGKKSPKSRPRAKHGRTSNAKPHAKANAESRVRSNTKRGASASEEPQVRRSRNLDAGANLASESRPTPPKPAKISLKPSTLLSPVPAVLISCQGIDPAGKPNLITLAWAGTICSDPPMISISIRPSRHSHSMVLESGEFVVNLVNERLLQATDFCGVKSGRDIDKFSECHLNPIPMEGLEHAPAVAESPLSLGCKVRAVQHYPSHDVFQGEIVSVLADANLMDEQGKLNLSHSRLVAYVHGEYFALGRLLGFYGFSVGSSEVLARRLPGRRPRAK